MKRYLDYFWPLLGLVAVVWSVHLLYEKLRTEALNAATDQASRAILSTGDLWSNLKVIADVIGGKLAAIPPHAYGLAFLSTLGAYAALAWYDRIALIHLRKTAGISFLFVATCSFVTYAMSHNIGASVFSGGMVRLRAYTAKGLTAAEVAVLVALCSFTFAFGTILLMGLVLLVEPQILGPLSSLSRHFSIGPGVARIIGVCMIGFCLLYTLGAWLKLHPLKIGEFRIVYPRMPIVIRQYLAAPLELMGAAGIIYFAIPWEVNPGFQLVLGAFLLSFSAGLLSQVPGGVGVMEAVFLAVMPQVPATAVFAALLVWRLFYLLLPLALSIPVIILFERSQIGKTTRDLKPPPPGAH
jgi:uncharacterized membrane protein YbhN (UPF0104 family)